MKIKQIMGFVAATGIIATIVALSFESPKQTLLAEGAEKTFTIDGSKPVGDNHVEDESEGLLSYDQVVSASDGTYIVINGTYIGTYYQTLEFNNPSYYLKGIAQPGMVTAAQTEVIFDVKGVTSLSYNATMTDEYEEGGTFLISVMDKDNNVLAAAYERGEQSLTVPSGISTKVSVYFWGFGTYTFTSITFNYTCPAI